MPRPCGDRLPSRPRNRFAGPLGQAMPRRPRLGVRQPVTAADASFLTLHEIVRAAYDRIDRNIWDYVVGGTETETTVRRNRHAIERLGFRPRVLRDVSAIDTGGRFLGRPVKLPIALAPVGGLESIGESGEILVARAAASFGVPFFLSSVTKVGMEEVA